MVEPKVSGPPPNSRGYPTFPRLSMMSISPLAGHSPYSLQRGRHQIAGQSQSPLGSLALTSTRPYWKLKELTVVSLPLMTGLMQWFPSLVLLQPQKKFPVHSSAGDPPQSSQVYPALTACSPILFSVRTGLMLSTPSLAKVVLRLLSQIWNSQLPPPARVISWRHLVKSRKSKLSSKMILLLVRTNTARRRQMSFILRDISNMIINLQFRSEIQGPINAIQNLKDLLCKQCFKLQHLYEREALIKNFRLKDYTLLHDNVVPAIVLQG